MESALKHLANIPGWSTKRNLVILESDDWGSIRMPSVRAFDNLSRIGIKMKSDAGYLYNRYDSLANAEDLAKLFEVLSSVRDSMGAPAVMTPVSLVANPDFTKIRESDFTSYFYEPFTETLERYYGSDSSFRMWTEGIEKGLFLPQFHGREHLNVKVWMKALKGKHENTLHAFDQGMWGISTANDPEINLEFQAAFDFMDPDDLESQEEVLRSGLDMFEKLFGYRASCFVPPNGPFSSKLEKVCFNEGIRFLSVPIIQSEPLGEGRTGKRYHWRGQKARSGLTYVTRNCFFEPVQPGRDWVDSCLQQVSTAFRWYKPAVISSHRINYIGALHAENRENGLKDLSLLLKRIVKTWPDTEFVSSAELGTIIENE